MVLAAGGSRFTWPRVLARLAPAENFCEPSVAPVWRNGRRTGLKILGP